MIAGQVTAALVARIPLHVEDGNGAPYPIDAVVDTGFSAYLSLPTSVVAALGLPFVCNQDIVLGDGTIQTRPVHSGVVVWDGQPRTTRIYAIGSEPLVGMKLLAGNELRIRVVDGGIVWIDVVP
jgi:clan AA aspartic protease